MDKTGINPKVPYVVAADPLVRELVPGYLRNRVQDLPRLAEALAAGDFAQLRQIGHNLRGSGAGYGLPPISDLGGRIEDAAQAQDRAALTAAIEDLRAFLELVKLPPA